MRHLALILALILALALLPGALCRAQAAPDPFLWLEDVDSPRAMGWVRGQNATTLARLQADPHYAGFHAAALRLAQSSDRVPLPTTIGGMVYNLWQDQDHAQGVWRRTTPADYRAASPHWTTVLDLDALSARDHRHWVFKGATCFKPAETRCLIALSDGGEDAVETRELDLPSGRFVPDGFYLPRAKAVADWLDADTLLVGTDWGAGSMTRAGYPYVIRKLRRGQPLTDATPYFKGDPADVEVQLQTVADGAGRRALIIQRALDFFHTDTLLAGPDAPTSLKLPQRLTLVGLCAGQLIVALNEAGNGAPAGSLAALDLDHPAAPLTPIFVPGPRQSVQFGFQGGAATTRSAVVAVIEDNVRGRAMAFTPHPGTPHPGTSNPGTPNPRPNNAAAGAGWSARTLPLPDNAALDIVDTSERDDQVFLTVTGFLTPTTLMLADLATAAPPAPLKALPAQFDASQDMVDQRQATSPDGTRIPYFIVHPRPASPRPASARPASPRPASPRDAHPSDAHPPETSSDRPAPTLLTAYGGFQVSMTPAYSPAIGKLWLERGGVYVLANIRGGGEFGPAWHDAGLKTHRQRVFDDFTAVARDLVATHVTDAAHLGIRGGSNGGLLMGVQFTQHPELYRAVIIDVPLLDMLRYEQIAAGASWVGEYGSVANQAERAVLARISPYANLRPGRHYPEPFIFTTTKDDRVGPQHARKFAARLAALHAPYFYYESIEGGHAAGANLAEKAEETALEMTYLAEKLMPPAALPSPRCPPKRPSDRLAC